MTHPQCWQGCLCERCLRHGDTPPLPPALPLGSKALCWRGWRLPAMCGRLASTRGVLPAMNVRGCCGRQSAAKAGCVSHLRLLNSAGSWSGLSSPDILWQTVARPQPGQIVIVNVGLRPGAHDASHGRSSTRRFISDNMCCGLVIESSELGMRQRALGDERAHHQQSRSGVHSSWSAPLSLLPSCTEIL